VIVWTLLQVTHSVAINMYGFDDPHVGALLRSHAIKKDVAVTMTLDSSQAVQLRGARSSTSTSTTTRC
jgi:hypothetical protein